MSSEKINEILDFAIKNEEEAYEFYMELASKMDRPNIKEIFEGFAHEEEGHKAKLLTVKRGAVFKASERKILDLKISDYTVDVEPSEDLNYQKALILAMKNEKAAFRLYSDLAEAADDENIRDLFLALAQEEAKHKLRFELEYDDQILTEN